MVPLRSQLGQTGPRRGEGKTGRRGKDAEWGSGDGSLSVFLAGETRRHLLLPPLCPHCREAHRHRPGGQKPEEDGRRRAVRCVGSREMEGGGRVLAEVLVFSGSQGPWGTGRSRLPWENIFHLAQRGDTWGAWGVSMSAQRRVSSFPLNLVLLDSAVVAVRLRLPLPRSVCQGTPAAGRQEGAQEENDHQEEHSEPLLQRGLQLRGAL